MMEGEFEGDERPEAEPLACRLRISVQMPMGNELTRLANAVSGRA